jgi:exodeoxyribonuclease III
VLLEWLATESPDVACLQELKSSDKQFPVAELRAAGYHAVWVGQPSWNGVAIIAKTPPILVRKALPGDDADTHARYLEAAVQGVLVGCLYAPNGNPQPGPKFAYKLAWLDRFNAHAATLVDNGVPVILAGDYNVVPTDDDIYNTRSWKKDALLQPAPRARFATLMEQGWLDALLARHGRKAFTFWDYMRNAWDRDAGLRIDHLLLNKTLAKQLGNAGVDRWVRSLDRASDHAPAWVEI